MGGEGEEERGRKEGRIQTYTTFELEFSHFPLCKTGSGEKNLASLIIKPI